MPSKRNIYEKIKNKNKIIRCGQKPLDLYRKVPIVATPVTFGISSLWAGYFSGSRYFRGKKNQKTKLALAFFFSETKNNMILTGRKQQTE